MTANREPRGSLATRALRVVPKLLRLALFLGVVYAVAVMWAMSRAEAEVEEIMRGLGAEMAQFPGEREGAIRQLYLNGAAIQLTTTTVGRPMEAVLDHYEARCMERDGRLAEQIAELQENPEVGAGPGDPRDYDGTAREVFGDTGFVACLDMGGERVDSEGLVARVLTFLESGDLADVGHLRYFYAHRAGEDDEGNEQTLVVAIWSDGDLEVTRMFPSEGDAPGRDVPGVPRPEGSQRLLSAWEEGEPYSMTLYVVPEGDLGALERRYRSELPARGWTLIGEGRDQPARMVTAERGDQIVTLVLATDDAGTPMVTVLTSD